MLDPLSVSMSQYSTRPFVGAGILHHVGFNGASPGIEHGHGLGVVCLPLVLQLREAIGGVPDGDGGQAALIRASRYRGHGFRSAEKLARVLDVVRRRGFTVSVGDKEIAPSSLREGLVEIEDR